MHPKNRTSSPTTEPLEDDAGAQAQVESQPQHSSRARPEGVSAQLQYLVRGIGNRTDRGVLVVPHDEEHYAEIIAQIPQCLPESSRVQLEPFRYQRFEYTADDEAWDEAHNNPAHRREEASAFVEAVQRAVNAAESVFELAAWAHAIGEQWTLSFAPPQRDDSKYERYGPDLRAGILEAIYGEDWEQRIEEARAWLSPNAREDDVAF